MLNVLITAAGVTTVWHMVHVAKKYYSDKLCIHLCDTNPRDLVPSATVADYYHQVPQINDKEYYSYMLELMRKQNIDVIVPLIDRDLFIWSCDNPDFQRLNIRSTGPCLRSAETLSNKRMLDAFLQRHSLPRIKILDWTKILPEMEYAVKKEVGCGSQGVFFAKGNELRAPKENQIIQEKAGDGETEVTAEIFNSKQIFKVFCRKRLAVKSGVCTKMEPSYIPEIRAYLSKIVQAIDCPKAFCAQFLRHDGRWCMIDCNLRIGAGTATSTAAGFQLVRAFWADICGLPVREEWLTPDQSVKKVLRVYDEIIIR